jgi:hypothetical protein
LDFISNTAGSGKGNDICDNSTNVFLHYDEKNIDSCKSNSSKISFYSLLMHIALDCVLLSKIPETLTPARYYASVKDGKDFKWC